MRHRACHNCRAPLSGRQSTVGVCADRDGCRARAQRLVNRWTYPPGTPVIVRLDSGEERHTSTTSMPFIQSSGHISIFLDGISGSYSFERVRLDEVAHLQRLQRDGATVRVVARPTGIKGSFLHVVDCPYCSQQHYHGGAPGQRHAPCGLGEYVIDAQPGELASPAVRS